MASSAAARSRQWLESGPLERVRSERLRLAAAPRRTARSSDLPFVVLVSALLVGGVVALLMFNTSMQAASFTEARLQKQVTTLQARQQSLVSDLEKLRSPQQVAEAAVKQGMVIPATVATLKIDTGEVLGESAPADRSYTPPLWVRVPKPSF